VSKTLPVPEKKSSVKVISVEDMIEKYVKVEDSMRFKGNEPVLPEKIEKEIIITRIEKIKLERKKLFDKMKKAKEEKEKKRLEAERIAEEEKRLEVLELAEKEQKKALENEETKKLEAIKLAEEEKIKELEEKRKKQGLYVIEKGDSLSTIAAKFKIKTKKLRALNNLGKKSSIQIGKKLIIPYDQKRIDAIARGEYIVEEGDTLSSIAEDFNLTTKEIMKYNKLKKDSTICLGKKILLPLPHKLAKVKKKRSKTKLIRKFGKKKFRKHFGKRKLRVTATAYSSHGKQTDKTPFLAAWNNRLHPGMKVIAVSRDMLTKYGMRNGTKVRIAGLPGVYRVRDKMNKRYRKRIDIYMGMNRRKALRWGRRSVVVYW
jgi:LysM repeat protein/3D (Asp-Asp-Asp) domain-containing protein